MVGRLKTITILYTITLTFLAIIPAPAASKVPSFSDKIEHFIAFLIFGILFQNSFKNMIFLIVYPVFHEGLQLLVSWRAFDLSDFSVNIIGVVCAYIVLHYVEKVKDRKHLQEHIN